MNGAEHVENLVRCPLSSQHATLPNVSLSIAQEYETLKMAERLDFTVERQVLSQGHFFSGRRRVPWCNGSTWDFDSQNPGSIPGGTTFFSFFRRA